MDLCCSGLAPRRLVPQCASKNASGRCFQDVMAASCRKDRNMSPSLWKVTQKQVCKWEIVQSQYIRTCKLLGVLVSSTQGDDKNIFLFSSTFLPLHILLLLRLFCHRHFLIFYQLTKQLAEAMISFLISVCPPAWNTAAPTEQIILMLLTFRLSLNSIDKSRYWLKSNKNDAKSAMISRRNWSYNCENVFALS